MEFGHYFTVSEMDVFVLIVFDFDANVRNIRFILRHVMRLIESDIDEIIRCTLYMYSSQYGTYESPTD